MIFYSLNPHRGRYDDETTFSAQRQITRFVRVRSEDAYSRRGVSGNPAC
jgi:hypothetical protein